MNDTVCVGIFNTRTEAEIARGLLEVNKIHSVITADDAGGMYSFPFNGTFGGAKLIVAKNNKSKAEKILNNK